MKLSKKSKYAWLAMAITASLLGGSVVEAAQTDTDFTAPITGNSDNDIDYEDAGVLDGNTYTFTKESTITVSNADAISVGSDVTITANDAPLHINAGRYGVLAGKNSNLTINAKDLNVSVKQDESKYKGSDAALIKSSGKLTINGDINGTIESVTSQGNAIGIMADTGELAINGNVTMKKDGGWGISYDTKTGWEPVGIYATGDVVNGGKATINGLVDMTVNGTALETLGELSEITVKGGHFISNAASDNSRIATLGMLLSKGTINLNVNEDKTDAGDAETVLVGDISLQDSNSHVNFGLSTKDSKWTGVADNDKGSNGTINLYLKNGATWENAVTGQSYGDVSSHGSYLTTLSGGSDTASAGNIFMKDTHDTTVEKYSGYTNVYYAHTGSGESTSDYTAGNFIIKSAAEGASISLITDNTGITMDNETSVTNVLNALAGKLTYSGYIGEKEKNLTGYVKIADGLTASSKALQTGNIDFSETDGKGSYKDGTMNPGFAPDHQVKTAFTTTLTGVKDTDTEYNKGGVIAEDGTYKFTEDSSITTTNVNGSDMNQATTIDAKGKTLTFNTNVTDNSTYHAIGANSTDGVTITADKLVINANSTKGRIEGINVGGQGQQNKDNPMKLTINGDTEMNIQGIGYTLGLYAAGNADVTFNGNVTAMGDKDSEWGLTSEKGAFGYYGCSLVYSGSNYTLQMGPKVTINGDVNAKINGNGLFANGGHAKLTINGGGNIEINKDNTHNYYALLAECGTTSLNVNLDDNYQATSARDNKLVLKGNITASTGAVNANEPEPYTYVNLGLATADSVWTGVAYNKFGDAGKVSGDKTFYGAINVFLQNGATWNNEEWGAVEKSAWGATAYEGSHLAKLIGGESEAKAGNIFQKDANSLTIDNYSGYANIYYAHEGNGEAAENYKAGDTIIKSAAAGSQISLITDNTGITMDNETSVTNVLNALAGKLTYSGYIGEKEKNLTGYVKIADGLTASSKALQTGNIDFSETDGKGSYKDGTMNPGFAPDHQVKTAFTTTLTGVKDTDTEYNKGGVIAEDGTYKFTEDSSITTTNVNGSDMNQATTIDAKGKTLTFNTNVTDNSTYHAIGANSTDGVTITADKLVINANSTKGRIEGINVGGQGQQNKDNPMKLTINGDTEMNIQGIGYTLGLYAAGNADVTFNGNVTAMGDKDSEWGLTSEKGAFGYYGCSLVYSGSNYTLQMGPKVTINGDVNAKINGNGLFANGGHAKLTINGGGNIEINKDNTHNYYALLAECGTTSLNVNLDDNYQATSARDNKLVLKGNITASTGAVNANEPEPYTYVNLGLATADSVWTGVAYNKFGDAGKVSGDKTFYGAINVFLQNGATWNNEEWGAVEKSAWGATAYEGSHLAKLIGGESEAKAGNIFQKDANSLTIDNYSGYANIYYAHEGNGEAAENYKAGDTIIKSAAAGSQISLITDNTGITMDNETSVTNVLNALAGKLTYSGYIGEKEKNLTGYVKIADGLTASSKALQTGNIDFSETDGKGSYKDGTMNPGFAPDHQVKTAFTTTLTGVKDTDTEYNKGGVIAEDGTYKFTEDSSITTTNVNGSDMNQATTIDAKGKTLTFNTNVTDNSTYHAIGANSTDGVTITADKLVINANSTKGRIEGINVGGQGQQNKDNPMKLTINGDTEMNIQGIGYTLGLYAAGNADVTFNGNVTAMGDKDSEWGLTSEKGAFGYYGCSLVYSGSNYTLQMGPKVTINGDVNAKINGNGLFANGGHAKLTINGGGNIEINKDNTHNYYALLAECGTTSLNVNLDDNYQATSARDNKLVLKGNITASTGAVNANEPEPYTYVNLGLATADSVWTGVAYNKFGDAGKVSGDKTFYGAINVFLQNGATWNNEEWGAVEKSAWGATAYEGSHLAKLIGGESEAKAGNIFQKDANSLTIDNYSGYANIYYAHEGNGEAAENYKAGDTIIKSAAAGSQISLITDNTGITMDNETSVTNVLNALAGKLTYSGYIGEKEKNLTGYVKIADGLTASSKALQTGNIDFSDKDGKGSLAEGTVTPGFTYPEEQVKDTYTQAITGITKDDYIYKQNGVLKEEGKYTFTKDPTKITVEEGSAIDAKADITIDTSKAKLELSGKEAGIKADGHKVSIKGSTVITGKDAISASNGGKVTLNGMTDIKAGGEGGRAISVAGKDSEVAITGHAAASITGAVYVAGGNLTVNTSGATTTMTGDVVIDGGKADITLGDKASTLTGNLSVSNNGQLTLNVTNGAKATGSYEAGDGTLTMNVKDGGYWILKDAAGTTSLYATSLTDVAGDANAPAAGKLIVNGGSDKAHTGYIDMTERTQDLNITNFSGHETFIMAHKDDGTFTSGDVNIAQAAAGSGLTLYTANNGIDMTDKEKVTDTLKALAKKAIYAEGNDAANGKNLTGEVKIGEGLTSSSAKTGQIDFSNQTGALLDGSVPWEPTIEEGDYETFVMKGARSAVTTSFHSWRDNMQDTYTGADLADEDGIFAKALGGKTSSDVSGLKDSNSYWGAQVGYDKALANGWHTGVAFDYRDGDSDYLLGGKGDNKLYSFGVYGVKKMDNGSYFRVAAKAGRVENEYDVYTELRNKLHADYKANAYGLTAEYGKTFGSEMSYITPKVQLTWSRVGSKDYTGSANNGATMNIYQDSYDSLVGRLGFEAGMKKAHGSLHAGLYLAHEFNGDIDTRYFAKDGGWKSTSFDGDDTWAELVLGGEYRLGRNSQLYADFARDLGGDFQRKWKLNAGIRLRF